MTTARKPPEASATDKLPPRVWVNFTDGGLQIFGSRDMAKICGCWSTAIEMMSVQESNALVAAARAAAFEEAAKMVAVYIDDLEEAKLLAGLFLAKAASSAGTGE
jgi:hypothetical protein